MIRRRPGSTRTDKLCPYTTRFRSARWAGPQKDCDVAMEKVRLGLVEEGTLNTKAWFIAGLALAWPDGHVEYFEGRVDGELTWPPRGLKGFGYDPMFVPNGFEETFGEMDPEKKHAMSQDRKSTRLNSSHYCATSMPSSA